MKNCFYSLKIHWKKWGRICSSETSHFKTLKKKLYQDLRQLLKMKALKLNFKALCFSSSVDHWVNFSRISEQFPQHRFFPSEFQITTLDDCQLILNAMTSRNTDPMPRIVSIAFDGSLGAPELHTASNVLLEVLHLFQCCAFEGT
jgi:hypothetical protein